MRTKSFPPPLPLGSGASDGLLGNLLRKAIKSTDANGFAPSVVFLPPPPLAPARIISPRDFGTTRFRNRLGTRKDARRHCGRFAATSGVFRISRGTRVAAIAKKTRDIARGCGEQWGGANETKLFITVCGLVIGFGEKNVTYLVVAHRVSFSRVAFANAEGGALPAGRGSRVERQGRGPPGVREGPGIRKHTFCCHREKNGEDHRRLESSMLFVREYAVVDTRLEYLELTRSGALEVFAVDSSELASVHGVDVPDHGAFVARVLPADSLHGPFAGVRDPATREMTNVWRRDRNQATIVPAAYLKPGELHKHIDELVVMNDDWFILGLRFEVDAEVRRVFNHHGFSALAKQHLRCFVVPENQDNGARVIVTVGAEALEPVVTVLPLFHTNEPTTLDLLRAFVEGPTAAPSPATTETREFGFGGVNSGDGDGDDDVNGETTTRAVRNLTGLFPHQARTVCWMESVEVGAAGEDDESGAIREPVRFGKRLLFPSGREVREKYFDDEKADEADAVAAAAVKGERRSGRFGTARAVEAALKTAMAAEPSDAETQSAIPCNFLHEQAGNAAPPRLPRGGLVAHPVGAGKTVIAAALMQRRFSCVSRDGTKTKTGTLVTCPRHVTQQWLAALREFAPSLRARRVDAKHAERETDDDSAFFKELDRDALPDWSPLVGGADAWDVLVVAHEDLPCGERGTKNNNQSAETETAPYHPLWNDPFVVSNPTLIRWSRLVVDEPQELLFEWRPTARETGAGVWLITQLRARHRWALSATPGSSDAEKRDIVSLTFGARLSRLEFRKVRNRWTSQRTKRDPPDMCLPTVPLHPQCVPVTLSWREAATVQLYTESFDATFANVVRYCGGWCDAAGDAEELEALDSFDFLGGDAGDGKVESLDQWHARLAHVMDVKLGKLETRRDVLVGVISEAETFADDQLKNEGGYNPFDQLDDLLTSEALFDEDDAEGWDGTGGGGDLQQMRETMRASMRLGVCDTPSDLTSAVETNHENHVTDFEGLGGDNLDYDERDFESGTFSNENERDAPNAKPLTKRNPVVAAKLELEKTNTAIDRGRRDLNFIAAAAAALRDERAECSVCFELLRGKTVSVLRCAHAFDAQCVRGLLLAKGNHGERLNRRVVMCPLCRAPTRRKNMCTFLHQGNDAETNATTETRNENRAPLVSQVDLINANANAVKTPTQTEATAFSAKTTALVALIVDILKTAPGDKIVVFAQWPETVAAMAGAVQAAAAAEARKHAAKGVDKFEIVLRPNDAVTLLGDAMSRARALAQFQNSDSDTPRVLFVSYQHHASGLNLHVANRVIVAHPYASRFSSPNAPELVSLRHAAAYERQAIGRVRRYPQTKPCYLYRLYALGTVEEELYAVWGWIV